MNEPTTATISEYVSMKDIIRAIPGSEQHQIAYILKAQGINHLTKFGNARVWPRSVIADIQVEWDRIQANRTTQ